MDKNLTQTLQTIKRGIFLFGDNLQETFRSSNAMKRSATSALKNFSAAKVPRYSPRNLS